MEWLLNYVINGSRRFDLFNRSVSFGNSILRELVKNDYFNSQYIKLCHDVTSRTSPQSDSRIRTEDWDYLIILDDCRYDLFEEVNIIEGDLYKENSGCGWTVDFLQSNFHDDLFEDTIYVTGAGWVADDKIDKVFDENPFHFIEDVWTYAKETDGGTIHPESVRKAAVNTVAEHPDRRMIFHFVQPHMPFIGDVKLDGVEHTEEWEALRKERVKPEEMRAAFAANLEIALKEVKKLLPALDGKVVITSDHGSAFGEFNVFGHPQPSVYLPPINEVPWLELECSRDSPPEPVEIMTDRKKDVDIEELQTRRLKDLGYLS